MRSASSGLKVAAFTSAVFSTSRSFSTPGRAGSPDGLLGLDDRAHPGRRPRPVNALVDSLYCSRWQGRTNGWDNRGGNYGRLQQRLGLCPRPECPFEGDPIELYRGLTAQLDSAIESR